MKRLMLISRISLLAIFFAGSLPGNAQTLKELGKGEWSMVNGQWAMSNE